MKPPALISTVLLVAATVAATPAPPVAPKRPHDLVSAHGTRSDPYYWLRDDTRSKPEVLDYLKAENAYFEAVSASYKALTETLVREMVGRLKQDDSSVPSKSRDYLYYWRYETGRQYPIYARRPLGSDQEQVLVDAAREAQGKEYYAVGELKVSARQDLLAFTEDTGGREQYTLRVREIATGRDFPERISGLQPGIAWADDNKTVFYALSGGVKKHMLGTDPKIDPVVYRERDASFYLRVGKSSDQRFLLILLDSTEENEIWAINADNPDAPMRILAPRERGVLYYADHIAGRWVIKTDWRAPNFRLMSVSDADLGNKARWKELLPNNSAVFIEDFALFKDHLAISERSDGLLRIRIAPWAALDRSTYIRADEPACTLRLSAQTESETHIVNYSYTSLSTPESVYDADMRTGVRTLLMRRPVPGYKPERYVNERVWAPARDGTKVPVSLAYRKGFKKDGSAPLYQYAYGAYGASSDPEFDLTVVSLLDRGFVYAIAHVRGGQEMGRAWYDDGRLLKKKNTFTDFIDVTDFLVREKYAAPDNVFASGASAGGLLMGAVANMAPEKYRGIVAKVPYVDAVTSMLDESIPLVSKEFKEWGNPKQKEYYDYMLTYSPYDNVRAQKYPAMLVTVGLNDLQVQYFEPTKWVAKLRATKTDKNPLLFKINMAAGHRGRTGLFEQIEEIAEEYAFILSRLGAEAPQVRGGQPTQGENGRAGAPQN